ncbi:MAG: carbohydrate ABC transporter permease [Clostridiales bacterium]|nr:carbohydrate ABC transporter permease [Clostridiales bacterium]
MSVRAKKKLGRAVLYALVLTIVIFTFAPYLWLIISSFSTKAELLDRMVFLFPEKPTLVNYQNLMGKDFVPVIGNSLVVTSSAVLVSLVLGVLAAYGYSRFRFRGRGPLLNLSLFTQMIPPIAMVIPMYVIFKMLGMMNTREMLIIIYLSLVLPYLIWIMKSYIDGIPLELEEAAMIDGCSKLRSFFTVVVPVIITGLAATVIFAFIITWNEFFYAFILTKTTAAKTLPVLVYDFNSKFGSNYVMSATLGVVASLPPVLVALIFQKYIIKGLAAGAVKG